MAITPGVIAVEGKKGRPDGMYPAQGIAAVALMSAVEGQCEIGYDRILEFG